VNESVAGDETVPIDNLFIHAEVARAVAYEFIEFLEGAFVEQEVDSFAGGQFSIGMLAGAAFGSPASLGIRMAAAELAQWINDAIGHKRLA